MNKLTLKVTGNTTFDYVLRIDGKVAKFEKNEYGNKLYYLETDKDEVDIAIDSFNELDSKVWFLMSTFFSIISIYGIFDVRYDKRPIKVNYKGKIKLQEFSNLNIAINPYTPTNKLFNSTGDCEIEDNESNRFYADPKLRKRLKVVKWMRFGLFVATIAIIMLCLM